MYKTLFLVFLLFIIGCNKKAENNVINKISNEQTPYKNTKSLDSIFSKNHEFLPIDFNFPVGKPDAKGYYNAQHFGENNHLGDDWNGKGGGNTDLGDPIYSIANGYVAFSENIGGGWGNVVRIIHKIENKYIESLYAHADTLLVKKGMFVKKGKQIATIGNANGQYYAHLHLEIRDRINMPIGGGYSKNTEGFIDPSKFISKNKKL